MQVKTSHYFEGLYLTLDIATQRAIALFVSHVEEYGLHGLQGRNKSSADIAPTTKKNLEKIRYAQKHCLWHYHLGVPYYLGEQGDMTSQYVLHYSRYDEFIILIDVVSHPPFALPSTDKMTYST